MEPASGRRFGRIVRLADGVSFISFCCMNIGHGRNQRAGIRMQWMADHRLGGAGLDHLAEVKYRHFAGQLRDCAHVMRDEQVGETPLAFELVEQRQNFIAYRDIECGNSFVENHEFVVRRPAHVQWSRAGVVRRIADAVACPQRLETIQPGATAKSQCAGVRWTLPATVRAWVPRRFSRSASADPARTRHPERRSGCRAAPQRPPDRPAQTGCTRQPGLRRL